MAETEKKVIPWWFFALFIGVGAIMLVAGVLWMIPVRSFLATAVEAPGEIVDWSVSTDEGKTMYSAVIEFTAADGETYQFTNSSSSSIKPKVGKPVTVLYDPTHPRDARKKGFFSVWGGPAIFLGLGGIFLALGLILLFKLRGKKVMSSDSDVDFMLDD